MNFELLAEQCLMERFDQLEKVWNDLSRYDSIEDIYNNYDFFKNNDIEAVDLTGAYAKVYKSTRGEDYVLKITQSGADSWVPYAKKVSSERLFEQNPLFPKIEPTYFREMLAFSHAKYLGAIAFIEKLYVSSQRTNKLVNIAIVNSRKMLGEPIPNVKNCESLFEYGYYEYIDFSGKAGILITNICEAFNINEQHLLEFYAVIQEMKAVGGHSIMMDMHSKNIGFRKDGSVVFFDPVN